MDNELKPIKCPCCLSENTTTSSLSGLCFCGDCETEWPESRRVQPEPTGWAVMKDGTFDVIHREDGSFVTVYREMYDFLRDLATCDGYSVVPVAVVVRETKGEET